MKRFCLQLYDEPATMCSIKSARELRHQYVCEVTRGHTHTHTLRDSVPFAASRWWLAGGCCCCRRTGHVLHCPCCFRRGVCLVLLLLLFLVIGSLTSVSLQFLWLPVLLFCACVGACAVVVLLCAVWWWLVWFRVAAVAHLLRLECFCCLPSSGCNTQGMFYHGRSL
jgi:hypothetical protein